MRRILRAAAVLFVLALAALAVFAIPTIWGRPWSIEHFYTRVFAETLWEHPMLLSQLRVLEPYGIRWHDDELDDFSVAFAEREAERVRKNLRTLREYPLDEQSEEQRFSTRVLAWYLQVLADGAEFQFHPFPLNQFDGIQTTLPDFLLNVHQIRDARGARDYVTRLEKTGVAIDQVIAAMRFRMERGIVPPRVIVERVGADVERFLAGGPEASPLLTHFAEQVAKLDAVSDQERGQLLGAARRAVGEVVWPAWERLRDFVPELAAKAHEEVGAWALPEGSLYYGWALRYHTTTNLGADAIHELGLREVERIHGEMRAILAAEGFAVAEVATEAVAPPPAFTEAAPAGGEPAAPAPAPDPAAPAAPAPAPAVVPSLGDVLRAVQANPPVRYGDDEAGRQRILADYQAIVDEAQRRLPELVTRLPRAPVRVERVPAFKESGAAGAYYMPAPLDGSKPGVFYANLRSPAEVVPFSMRTLAYHEAIPGHHLQIALAQEMSGVPFFRRVIPFTAFIEGWALYAESLGAELGLFTDPYQKLGNLFAESWRAARLVVDTGIHTRGWSREQAIDYMLAHTAAGRSDATAEVERYIAWPGQALAYKIGQLRIAQLRARAEQTLGPGFDVRAFHAAVIGDGSLPLAVLERHIDRWIRDRTS